MFDILLDPREKILNTRIFERRITDIHPYSRNKSDREVEYFESCLVF